MFGNELRLEAAVTVPWDIDRQRTKITLERLGAAAVTGVAAVVDHRFMLVVTQVNRQFGLQCTLHNGFGQLLEYPVLTKQVFRFLVISQQSINQVGLYYFAFGHRSSL